jgi:hypothetical protein
VEIAERYLIMEKEKYLKKIKKFKTKDDMSLDYYEGYNALHIDIRQNDEVVAWLVVEDDNVLKICKTKENLCGTDDDIRILKTIKKLSKFMGMKKVYGRINIENENCKKTFQDMDFHFEESFDKSYRTAIVSFS